MSQLRRRRRALRWARMFNRYGHIPHAAVGGWAAVAAMKSVSLGSWSAVRRQRPHPYGKGYRHA